jgi:hypothetical protein
MFSATVYSLHFCGNGPDFPKGTVDILAKNDSTLVSASF